MTIKLGNVAPDFEQASTEGRSVVMVPSLQDEAELAARFPQGYDAVSPYLRLTLIRLYRV